jgi:hypothetical protein
MDKGNVVLALGIVTIAGLWWYDAKSPKRPDPKPVSAKEAPTDDEITQSVYGPIVARIPLHGLRKVGSNGYLGYDSNNTQRVLAAVLESADESCLVTDQKDEEELQKFLGITNDLNAAENLKRAGLRVELRQYNDQEKGQTPAPLFLLVQGDESCAVSASR